ncbi:uncharacterized protein LOC127703111 [Mytilus californianus]|uniref:uncharacterized protein LOC127703111 n=1 Tax=Mytilus californianus TaxID=6549 RepID=UPI0022483439|nr:uncharacterized protein LOC127703111 [Mytilus californianus]
MTMMSLESWNTLIWLLLYVNTATSFQGKKETPKCNYNNSTFDDTCCPSCMNSQNDTCKTYECPKDYYHFNTRCYGKHNISDPNKFVCKAKCPSSHYGITINKRKVCLACMILCQDRSLKTTCSCEDIHKEIQLKGILLYIFIGISILLVITSGFMVVYICCKNQRRNIINNPEKCIQVDERDIMENYPASNVDKTRTEAENLGGKPKASSVAKEAQIHLDKKTRYTKDPTVIVEQGKKFQKHISGRPLSSAYVNASSIRRNKNYNSETNKINKTTFQGTKCNLSKKNDDERNIKISKDGGTLSVGNGNTLNEDRKEGDSDTVGEIKDEDPEGKGYDILSPKDETIEITDIENITQSNNLGMIKESKATSFQKSDFISKSSKTIIPVQEPFVQTLPESDIHQYENYQGSTSDVDNINPTEIAASGNTSVSDMRQLSSNTNVNEKIASIGLNNFQSNRCSQDSSDSNRSEDSYKSARSHASLPEDTMEQKSSNEEQTTIEIDTTNNASVKNDVKNITVLKGSLDVTKIASQPNINVTGTNLSLNFYGKTN